MPQYVHSSTCVASTRPGGGGKVKRGLIFGAKSVTGRRERASVGLQMKSEKWRVDSQPLSKNIYNLPYFFVSGTKRYPRMRIFTPKSKNSEYKSHSTRLEIRILIYEYHNFDVEEGVLRDNRLAFKGISRPS